MCSGSRARTAEMTPARYDRNDPTYDHAGFGAPLECLSGLLGDERPSWLLRRSAPMPFWFPAGNWVAPPGLEPRRTEFLRPARATFLSGMTDRGPATLMYPDTAVILEREGRPFLLEETYWHSTLHENPSFRADASTGWRWRWFPPHVERVIEGESIVANNYLGHIYFHWFFDVLCKVWLYRQEFPMGRPLVFAGPLDQAFKAPSLAMFGIGPDQVVEAPQGPAAIRFENAYVPVFAFREPLKTRFARGTGIHHKCWSPDYTAAIRELALHHFAIPRGPKDRKLYIDRIDTGYRRVLNADELRDFMVGQGFTPIVPGQLGFAEQVEAFSRARVIVGCHGAGFTNLLWSGIGTSMVEFMPDGYDDAGYRFLSFLTGADYTCLFSASDDAGDSPDNYLANCTVDIPTLARVLAEI